MSKATKRKYVTREVLDDYVTPENKQIIVKVVKCFGVFFMYFFFTYISIQLIQAFTIYYLSFNNLCFVVNVIPPVR